MPERNQPYQSLQADEGGVSGGSLDLRDDQLYSHQAHGSCWQILVRHRWLIDTVLLFGIVALLFDKATTTGRKYHHLDTTGDVTGFVPKFSNRLTSFSPDSGIFPDDPNDFFTNKTREKWLSLVPDGLGYLYIQKPSEYDSLPTPLSNYQKTGKFVVTTSVTHQLHCLYSIAQGYAVLAAGKKKDFEEASWHMNHCFDYLRQSIMCCGDVALEGQQTSFAKDVPGSDGWDAIHVCKNYNEVYRFLDKHKALKKHWI